MKTSLLNVKSNSSNIVVFFREGGGGQDNPVVFNYLHIKKRSMISPYEAIKDISSKPKKFKIALKHYLLTHSLFFIYNFGLGSSSALLPPGGTATSVADARGLL
jgi:hypothetical protein